jgi:hypothetical protein
MLRQEVYTDDGTPQSIHPYTVTESNYSIEVVQPLQENRHAVFFVHSRESLNYHYERKSDDPRVSHKLTLEVRRIRECFEISDCGVRPAQNPIWLFQQTIAGRQTKTLITCTEGRFTNSIQQVAAYRTPLPSETQTFELTGLTPSSDERLGFRINCSQQ